MTRLTLEWVTKAEGDFHTAQREVRARKLPNHDSACFHSQQCVEKYVKARLQEAGIAIPHTHDLELLLKLALPVEPLWSGLQPAMRVLTVYAVKVRYPGSHVSRTQAKEAFIHCRAIRKLIRLGLGLKP
ncbi:MAG: HEPN domain-containing protein [Tepidisphaerales bacterium]